MIPINLMVLSNSFYYFLLIVAEGKHIHRGLCFSLWWNPLGVASRALSWPGKRTYWWYMQYFWLQDAFIWLLVVFGMLFYLLLWVEEVLSAISAVRGRMALIIPTMAWALLFCIPVRAVRIYFVHSLLSCALRSHRRLVHLLIKHIFVIEIKVLFFVRWGARGSG